MSTLTSIPSQIVAGDNYIIDLMFNDYVPANGYTAVLYLRGIQVLRANSTPNGDAFRFTLSSTNTSILSEGTYEYSVGVILSGQRTTVANGFIAVKPDFATAGARVSHIEKTLQAIQAVIEGRVLDDVESFSIAGRSINHIPIMELLELRAQYTKELVVLSGNGNSIRKIVKLNFRGVR